MTAILLAAGVGKRMGPEALPKSLLTVGGQTLIQRILESLRTMGVQTLVVVVGYRREELVAHLRAHAGAMHLTIVENPRYREGAILSLWAARDHLNGNLLIMDADVLCPHAAFERLVRSAHPNCLLIDGSVADTGEEQIVLGQGERVLYITKRPSAEIRSKLTPFGESVGFLKLSRESAQLLRQLLEEKVEKGAVTIEHEEVYPDLFQRVSVGFEKIDGLPWAEIDTLEDLERAEKEVYAQWGSLECLNRRMSRFFLPWVVPLPLTPNQWTILSLLVGLVGIQWLARGDYMSGLLGALLFHLFYIIDNWDGEVARLKGLSSRWGGWFDVTVDMVVHVALPIGLALGLRHEGAPPWVIPLGFIAAFGVAIDFLVTMWAKVRGFGPAIHGDSWIRQGNLSSFSNSQWLSSNLTNENFSLVVIAFLLLNWRLPFLLFLAIGCQFFWASFLYRQRRRLFAS